MMKRSTIPAFLAAAFLAAISADAKVLPARKAAPTFEATITRAVDGDTLFVKPEHGPEVKVRLHFADCPEIAHTPNETDQPGGREALDYVKKHWQGKAVTVTQHGVSYGRPIVDVVETASGKNLALDEVRLGLAQVDPRFHPPQAFKDAQKAAMLNHLGVFAETQTPMSPADWRKQQRNKKDK